MSMYYMPTTLIIIIANWRVQYGVCTVQYRTELHPETKKRTDRTIDVLAINLKKPDCPSYVLTERPAILDKSFKKLLKQCCVLSVSKNI